MNTITTRATALFAALLTTASLFSGVVSLADTSHADARIAQVASTTVVR